MMADTARSLAVRLLLRTFTAGGYSNLLLDQALDASDLNAADKRLCAMLYYGVTERLLTLEHVAGCYTSRPVSKLDREVRFILYLGLYQLLYCEKIPDRAAVSETVALTGVFRKKSASGFVNAVLRSFLRDGKEIHYPEDKWLRKQAEFSAPAELIRKVSEQLGEERADRFFANALLPPPVTIRLNTVRAQESDIADLNPNPCADTAHAYFTKLADVSHTESYRKGFFHVQDLAPQLCCQALGAQPGETVFDVCAAPGGKTFTIAEMMENRGTVYAFDLHPNRVKLVTDGAARLGLSCIRAEAQDAKQFRDDLPQADRVLCDVPCSGLGVIRRKPEIKYKPLSDFSGLPDIQLSILENASRYLRPGGILVYATCTVLREENEAVLEQFLAAHPEFSPVPLHEFGCGEGYKTFTCDDCDCDGFFVGRLKKEG